MQQHDGPACLCACRCVHVNDARVRLNDVVLFDRRHPCTVSGVRWSAAGKHGWTKLMLVGTDLVTGEERTSWVRHGESVYFPPVTTTAYNVTGVSRAGPVVTLWLGNAAGAHRLDVQDAAQYAAVQRVLAEGACCAVTVQRITFCDHAVMPPEGGPPDDRLRFVERLNTVTPLRPAARDAPV